MLEALECAEWALIVSRSRKCFVLQWKLTPCSSKTLIFGDSLWTLKGLQTHNCSWIILFQWEMQTGFTCGSRSYSVRTKITTRTNIKNFSLFCCGKFPFSLKLRYLWNDFQSNHILGFSVEKENLDTILKLQTKIRVHEDLFCRTLLLRVHMLRKLF